MKNILLGCVFMILAVFAIPYGAIYFVPFGIAFVFFCRFCMGNQAIVVKNKDEK